MCCPPRSTFFPYTTLFRSVLDEEGDCVSVRAAAEAVIELLGRADGKRRRLLGVERAAREIVRPALLQRDVASDHVDDIDAMRSEEHTSEIQSLTKTVCRLR